jgi:hypothetical protein
MTEIEEALWIYRAGHAERRAKSCRKALAAGQPWRRFGLELQHRLRTIALCNKALELGWPPGGAAVAAYREALAAQAAEDFPAQWAALDRLDHELGMVPFSPSESSFTAA